MTSFMQVDNEVALEVASHEALIRQTYFDSKKVPTWCVGMTNATGHRVERYIGKPASLQHCMNLFAWALTNYATQVAEAFKDRPLTKAQFAAALSFHWNTGAIRTASWVRNWVQGEDAKARIAFMNWVTPKEITERREKERDLFFDGKWSNNGTMLEYTRVTSRMTPDWKSGRRIDVSDELRAAFAGQTEILLDQAPQPDAVPQEQTLTPSAQIEEEARVPIPTPRPNLSPIQATMKANVGATTGAFSGGGIGPGIIYLWSTLPSFPSEWANDPQALILLTGFVAGICGWIGGWLGTYFTPDKRFKHLT